MYNINTTDENITELRTKNLCISLINDKAFDMDKLDYIMRDSLYTGIGTPRIDTKRLFRNLRITKEYKLVFMSKAVPTLQNLIESRDSLYMWVYNHHSVIYSDFIYGYIFRRLGHNAEKINESEKLGAGIVPRNFINRNNDYGTNDKMYIFPFKINKNYEYPANMVYFHRTLSNYINTAINAGFEMVRMNELFENNKQKLENSSQLDLMGFILRKKS